MSTHYEWWAKAGGAPGYSHELEKHEYIKNFVWLENWIDKHFFNKVFDTLVGTMVLCFLVVISFFFYKHKKLNLYSNNNKIVYFLLLIFF